MKAKHLGAAVVLAAAVGIVVLKEHARSQPGEGSAAFANSAAPAIVLIADPAEAEAPCGCGQIIRAVRTAASRGVPTKEIDPGASPAVEAPYGVKVTPTVLVLDGSGREIRRFEGESKDVVNSVSAELERMKGKAP